MTFKNIHEMIEYPREGILSKVLFKSEKDNVTLFCMAAGTDISEHTSTKQGIVYVVEGSGVFNLAGSEIEMKPGVLIFLKRGVVHSLRAIKNTSYLLSLHA